MPEPRALSDTERAVLAALTRPGIRVSDRTVDALARSAGLGYREVSRALRDLARDRDGPLAVPRPDDELGLEIWFTTERAAAAME